MYNLLVIYVVVQVGLLESSVPNEKCFNVNVEPMSNRSRFVTKFDEILIIDVELTVYFSLGETISFLH